jgi:hypothetical protein
MPTKKEKIFIGFSEVANFVNTYKLGFEEMGYKTFSVVTYRSKFYTSAKYDVVLSEIRGSRVFEKTFLSRYWKSLHARITCLCIFLYALLTCEIFYYNTGGNVLPFRLDYILIRLFRKKLVVIFLGSEIRHWYLYKMDVQTMGFDEVFSSCIKAYKNQNFGTYLEKRERVRSAETYANLILSQPGFSQLISLPYSRLIVGLNLKLYKSSINKRKCPLIIHAPSVRGIKGTEFVLETIEKLKNEGIAFEFKLIENMRNEDLLVLLADADIVIDQLNSDTFGVLSTEAMATGNAVVTSYMPDLVKMPMPCPVLNTNKLNVYENVKRLILDIDFRVKLSLQGLEYSNKYHDIKQIIQRDLKILNTPEKERVYDYIPLLNPNFEIPTEILEEERKQKLG